MSDLCFVNAIPDPSVSQRTFVESILHALLACVGTYGDAAVVFGDTARDLLEARGLDATEGFYTDGRTSCVPVRLVSSQSLPVLYGFWDCTYGGTMGIIVRQTGPPDVAGVAMALKHDRRAGCLGFLDLFGNRLGPWECSASAAWSLAQLGDIVMLRGHDGIEAFFLPNPPSRERGGPISAELARLGLAVKPVVVPRPDAAAGVQ